MRVTKEVAALNRRKILETATQLSKARGIDDVSVADLTKAAGFTHGGIYNHFGSKPDLAVEAIRYAFEQALREISRERAATTGDVIPMVERLAEYLSPEHRDEPADGCPTGSLPVDVGRQAPGAQRAFANGLERYVALMRAYSLRSSVRGRPRSHLVDPRRGDHLVARRERPSSRSVGRNPASGPRRSPRYVRRAVNSLAGSRVRTH